jgi:hypothetical protein
VKIYFKKIFNEHLNQKILKEIDKKLEEKKVCGIGEVLVRH